MEQHVIAKTNPKASHPLHADLADVALIDAATCAAAGSMSVSWWLEEVRAGRAPQPVIREVRCTRWRLADVRDFWRKRAETAREGAGAALIAKAKHASDAAKAKRQAAAA
jgi:predicted DNA-binding transcriptional regulator AlpA